MRAKGTGHDRRDEGGTPGDIGHEKLSLRRKRRDHLIGLASSLREGSKPLQFVIAALGEKEDRFDIR